MRQLPLNLSFRAAFDRENFLVSACNAQAVDRIDRWPDWPVPVLRLSGPAGSGKTHLLHVWRARGGARILSPNDGPKMLATLLAGDRLQAVAVDNADGWPDPTDLLHLYNRCREDGAFLLLAARTGAWRHFQPADLRSRLAAMPEVALGPPDEDLLAALLLKQLGDRRLAAPPEVLSYLLPRLERSFAAVRAVATLLDREALATRRRLTIPLAARVLALYGAGGGKSAGE